MEFDWSVWNEAGCQNRTIGLEDGDRAGAVIVST